MSSASIYGTGCISFEKFFCCTSKLSCIYTRLVFANIKVPSIENFLFFHFFSPVDSCMRGFLKLFTAGSSKGALINNSLGKS